MNDTFNPTPGREIAKPINLYVCKRCGWSGETGKKRRCLRCAAAYTAKWRGDNPEKAKEQKKRWAEKKPNEYWAKRKRIKRANNPETVKFATARRNEWLKNGNVTTDELKGIYARDNGRCIYCKTAVDNPRFYPYDPRGFDHVLPRVKGGMHTRNNIVVSCRRCNERKAGN